MWLPIGRRCFRLSGNFPLPLWPLSAYWLKVLSLSLLGGGESSSLTSFQLHKLGNFQIRLVKGFSFLPQPCPLTASLSRYMVAFSYPLTALLELDNGEHRKYSRSLFRCIFFLLQSRVVCFMITKSKKLLLQERNRIIGQLTRYPV